MLLLWETRDRIVLIVEYRGGPFIRNPVFWGALRPLSVLIYWYWF